MNNIFKIWRKSWNFVNEYKTFSLGFMFEMVVSLFLIRFFNDEFFKFLIVIVDEKLFGKVDDKKIKVIVFFIII